MVHRTADDHRFAMNAYHRIFGTGPRGTFYSGVLLVLAVVLREPAGLPAVTTSLMLRYGIFGATCIATLALITWSIRSLPVQHRGQTLVSTGAYRQFRHPLYAAFVSCFNFGLAVLLNNWIYVLWALVMIQVWGLNVRREERMMRERFGPDWDEYAARTRRFFPRIANQGPPAIRNLLTCVLFSLLFYGMWMLVYPVFFFLPLILLLLHLVQQRFTGPLALRATLSVLCSLPFLVRELLGRLGGGGAPVADFLLLLTWSVIIVYWLAALAVAAMLRRAALRDADTGTGRGA